MEPPQALPTEWTGTSFLWLLLGTICLALAWPYVLQLVGMLWGTLNRATSEERERQSELRALLERQSANRRQDGEDRSSARHPSSTSSTDPTDRTILPPAQQRAVGIRGGGGGRSGGSGGVPVPSPSPEILPLKTLGDLLGYEKPGWGCGFAPKRPLPFVAAPFPPLKSRLLVCHDLAGGYGEDKLVQGGGYERPYRMYDWGLIDIFVYFSHELVTIPTAGWIDVAHRHGTRVLGTFITEWDKGYDVCAELLRSEETAERAAAKLVQIAVDHGFDGWLVNIENGVKPGKNIDVMVHFLKSLTAQMRAATSPNADSAVAADTAAAGKAAHVHEEEWNSSSNNNDDNDDGSRRSSPPFLQTGASASGASASLSGASPAWNSGSTVLWYDSVGVDGKLKWQNRLNEKNRVFFDACDGIFTNYAWKADYPSACALQASARRYDVYMGIDTFGRGTWGGGRFDVDKALGKIRRAGVSAALFAPAWTMEDETTGGGKVDPDPGRGGWTEVEQEFGEIDSNFWSKIAAAWQPPRSVPGFGRGGRGGAPPPPLLPLVVNFGHGVGNAWRIKGEEVAVFRAASAAVTADGDGTLQTDEERGSRSRLEAGGAFYDMASQCLTPLIGGRGGAATIEGQRPDVVQAKRAGDPSASTSGANGTIRARYSFAESFDGGSSLRFTGVLSEKAVATFPLYSCDVPLPAEPLEIRMTFCGNPESDMALVLSLDVPGQLGGRREVVLRDCGREGVPKKQAVFSKRLTYTEAKATYCPVREEYGREMSTMASAEDGLQARVSALRDAGQSYDSIWKRLRTEREKGGYSDGERNAAHRPSSSPPSRASASAETAGNGPRSSPSWTTRTYVVRDLRMGGSRSIREVSLVCARRKTPAPAEGEGEEPAAGSLRGGRRLGAKEDGESSSAVDGDGSSRARGGALRGVAGFAAYRAFLGEVAIGPWRQETPCTFGKIEGLHADEVACFSDDRSGGGGGGGSGVGTVSVDLSLAWESEGCVQKTAGRGLGSKTGGVFGAGSPWATLHCDLWRAVGTDAPEGGTRWQWLGRAYGQKYRLNGLRIDSGGGEVGREEGGRKEATEGSLVLAVQQVNAMGYREPVEDWARLQLRLP